jgi:hypothetical protein
MPFDLRLLAVWLNSQPSKAIHDFATVIMERVPSEAECQN